MCVSIKAKIAACKCQNKDKQRYSRMHKVLHTKLNPFLKGMHLHKHTLTHYLQKHTITGGTFELQEWYSLCSVLASLTEPLLLSLLLLSLYLISSKEYFSQIFAAYFYCLWLGIKIWAQGPWKNSQKLILQGSISVFFFFLFFLCTKTFILQIQSSLFSNKFEYSTKKTVQQTPL